MKKKEIIIFAVIIIAAALLIMWREGAFKKKSAKNTETDDENKEDYPQKGVVGGMSGGYYDLAITPSEIQSGSGNQNAKLSSFEDMRNESIKPKRELVAVPRQISTDFVVTGPREQNSNKRKR